MLDKYVQADITRSWIQNSIFDPFISTYIVYLESRGYSESTIRAYVRSLAHFAYWVKKKKIRLSHIDEKTINQFICNHLPCCKCPKPCRRALFSMRAALNHFFVVLKLEGMVPAGLPTTTPLDEELKRFDHYLNEVRGLASETRISRIAYTRNFLFHCFNNRSLDIMSLSPGDILQYTTKCGERVKPATVQVICTGLRSYLRYRGHEGDRTEMLVAAVPSAANWRLSSVPKALTAEEIKRIIESFDCSTSVGKRDYAIARCLIDLGLRASEVAHILIDDLNWRDRTLRIHSAKGNRQDILPLPSSTFKAIVDYLRFARPENSSRALFVRHRAPLNSPIGPGVIRSSMRMAYRRCGLSPIMGTHTLRHSVACRMVNSGVSLKEIADVLRHRSIDTTIVYAKADISHLSHVAAPWPGSSL